MLVITRKSGEGFRIGENARITVMEIGRDRVKIGIDAPRDVRIIREELFDTENFNKEAASTKPGADLMQIINSTKG